MYKMSCNVDLLHVGIWTLYSGCSILLGAVISYAALEPVEKETLLQERIKLESRKSTQTSYSVDPVQFRARPGKKKVNFLV